MMHRGIGWLELNSPRVAEGQDFYCRAFGWRVEPLHLPNLGMLPLFTNGVHEPRQVGACFMALGAFSPSRWLVYLAADVEAARDRLSDLGGTLREDIVDNPGWGRTLLGVDPDGGEFTLFEEALAAPGPPRPREPIFAECWASDGASSAAFYGSLLGLEVVATERGSDLVDVDGIRHLAVRTNPFAAPPAPWIPYFRTACLGADRHRMIRHGAIETVPQEDVPCWGKLALFFDPAGAIFGLIEPADG